MKKELSVIIPAYNEEQRIERTLSEIAVFLRGQGYRFEILVMNDGSSDSTAALVRRSALEYPEIRLFDRADNRGKGWTVKEGIEQAGFPYTLFMDADNSTSIEEWPKFESEFRKGARSVSASRHLAGSVIVHQQPWVRRFLGGGYRVICRALYGLESSDFNCGMKAYETGLAKKVYARTVMSDWTFDVEVICYLKEEGVVPAEVAVRWKHCEKKSNLRPVRTAAKLLLSLMILKKHLSSGKGKVSR